MDIDAHPGVDYVGDVSDLSRFADGSISVLFASNILEHFPHTKTLDVLREWNRVLEAGGKLHLSVPDFSRVAELYVKHGFSEWIQNFLMGDQEYKTAFHYAIFDESRLMKLCGDAGFSTFERVYGSFPFAELKDCSNLVSNIDGQQVCLNATVVK